MGDRRTATVTELQRDGILLVEDGNHGEYRPRPDEFVDRGVAFIRAADMDAGRVLFESAAKINERAKKRITKGIGAPGDVLLSHKGTVGKLALVPDEAPPFVCSPQTTFWRTRDENRLDRKYLYAFLRSPGFHAQLATRAGETDMAPYVSLTSQRGLSVILPPIEEQRAIAQILGALDDKIDLNRRMNETLEGIVRAIFKDWFVDFGPTRAKAEGSAPYFVPEIWALFPDRLDDEDKPEGWIVKKVGDLIERLGVGKKYEQKTVFAKGTVPVLDQGKSGVIGYHSEQPGVIASLSRPVVVFANHTCYMRLIMFPFSAIQNVLPFVGKGVNTIWVYYATLDRQKFIEYKGHWPDFVIHEVVTPTTELTEAFSSIVEPINHKILSNERENEILAQTCDMLLPKLMSGEIRLRDAEKIVEAAA
jgi:type I restriction enzyme S subunit